MLLVPDGVGSGRGVMAVDGQHSLQGIWGHGYIPDLLTDQAGLTNLCIRVPLAQEQLSEEGVERLLLTAELLTAAAVLLVKCAEEPLEDSQCSLFGISFFGRSHEQSRVFGPVGGILSQGGGGEDERGCGQGGKVSIEGSDRLQSEINGLEMSLVSDNVSRWQGRKNEAAYDGDSR